MSILSFKHLLAIGTLFAGSAMLFTGCVSDDYDLDNVDLTMGLGSDGLKVKLGNTQRIMLDDILDLDETVKLDKSNLYYMVKDGSTHFTVHVDPVDAMFDKSRVTTQKRVLDYEGALEQFDPSELAMLPDGASLPIPADLELHGRAYGTSDVKISFDVPMDVKYIDLVDVKDMEVTLNVHTETSANVKFGIDVLEDFSIQIPRILKLRESSIPQGWKLDAKTNILKHEGKLKIPASGTVCTIVADKVDPLSFGTPVNGRIEFGSDAQGSVVEAGIDGMVYFKATDAFELSKKDYADIYLELQLGNGNRIDVEKLTGKFDPSIDPDVNPIEVASSLPDFLDDDAVRIGAANPTLKFNVDLSAVPVGMDFSADLKAVTEGQEAVNVLLPKVELNEARQSTVYYYESERPYDPEAGEVASEATQAQVENLSALIENLPDEIRVNLGGGKVKVQDKLYTIELGKDYNAVADYKVYVPFQFDRGLTIVYKDSAENIHKDLKDYQAEGGQINAGAENTIPLDLIVTIEAYDVNNKLMPGIRFDQATVGASENGIDVKQTPITINAKLDNPALLSQMDRLKFHVKAANDVNGKTYELRSTQYLRIDDIRLRLSGQVTADLN